MTVKKRNSKVHRNLRLEWTGNPLFLRKLFRCQVACAHFSRYLILQCVSSATRSGYYPL